MTDKELIQALREDAEWAEANEWETPITLSDNLTDAADRLEALLAENERLKAQLPKWVSVDERLPADKQDVLAISNDGVESRVYPANYDCGTWFDCFFMEQNKHTTHWMPLPSTEGVE